MLHLFPKTKASLWNMTVWLLPHKSNIEATWSKHSHPLALLFKLRTHVRLTWSRVVGPQAKLRKVYLASLQSIHSTWQASEWQWKHRFNVLRGGVWSETVWVRSPSNSKRDHILDINKTWIMQNEWVGIAEETKPIQVQCFSHTRSQSDIQDLKHYHR